MITVAMVVEVHGKTAVVEVRRKSACDGCHKKEEGGCSVCTLLGGEQKLRATAKNGVGAKVGDSVEIASPTGKILLYCLLVFLLPVIAAVAGYFIAVAAGASETTAALSAGIGFAAVLVADSVVSHFIRKKECDVNIVKIIN